MSTINIVIFSFSIALFVSEREKKEKSACYNRFDFDFGVTDVRNYMLWQAYY